MNVGAAIATDRLVTLRIDIGGEWDIEDFREYFWALDRICFLFRDALDPREGVDKPLSRLAPPIPTVTRIDFASAGITDITGVGAVVGHLKDLIIRAIDLWADNPMRRAHALQEQEKLRAMQIQNARDVVQLVSEARQQGLLSDKGFERLVRELEYPQDALRFLVASGRITGARMLDE